MTGQLGIELEVIYPGGIRALRRKRAGRFRAAIAEASLGASGAEVRWRGHASLAGYAALARVVEGLREASAGVDAHCGLHVHIGLTAERGAALPAIGAWFDVAGGLRALFPERWGNPHCQPIARTADCLKHRSELSVSRRHPTLEFRLHPGTVLWPEVVCWADWCWWLVHGRTPFAPLGSHYLAARRWNLRQHGSASPRLWCHEMMDEATLHGFREAFRFVGACGLASMEEG